MHPHPSSPRCSFRTLPAVLALLAASFLLTGYRPDWEAHLAKKCWSQMRALEQALRELDAEGIAIRGEGEPPASYPIVERGKLAEIPVCPAGREHTPAPLEYRILASPPGQLLIHCPVHGPSDNVNPFPEDPAMRDLVDKAKTRWQQDRQAGMALLIALLWGGPPALFAGGVLVAGKRRMAALFPLARRLYLLPNYAILIGAIPAYIAAPIPPGQELVKLLAIVAAVAVGAVWALSPAIEAWGEPDPAPAPSPAPQAPPPGR
ncbi:MAG: hypothetical protein GX442_10265 [Candidatus Riflebacteria bacterium]|nr:hypothetical protein [Candidatus Riflebacteria bacterium]